MSMSLIILYDAHVEVYFKKTGELMDDYNEILKLHVSEQIALEEQACRLMEEQIKDLDEIQFAETREILIKAVEILENNFEQLNSVLSKLEDLEDKVEPKSSRINGYSLPSSLEQKQNSRRISKMIRDDYSALNLITMSNTLLHTTALTLKNYNIAELALQNLKLLAPLVVRLGEIAPLAVIMELNLGQEKFDTKIAETALLNTKQAWKSWKRMDL